MELFVDASADTPGNGSPELPFRSISDAAVVAEPGDTITIGAGTYREWVRPPRGGSADSERITYRAAAGQSVVVSGAERFSGWEQIDGDIWRLTIDNDVFGEFNPFAERVSGDWFDEPLRAHHLGMIFVDDVMLPESVGIEAVFELAVPGWHATVSSRSTEIIARMPEVDPNVAQVELTMRRSVFSPTEPNIDFITIQGLTLTRAATNWAPPTAGQEGLVTAYWCKGWIIENNVVSWSRCSGIALGKYRDDWDGLRGTTEGYRLTIVDARGNDWNKQSIGGHIVRNNVISHCGQAGIVGSLGCSFSEIVDNDVSFCNWPEPWNGAEMAGIKLHGAIDTLIARNHVHHNGRWTGLWLDWMAQGTVVIDNLFHDNQEHDLFVEVCHGPVLVANNFFLSAVAVRSASTGLAFVHNLIAGSIEVNSDDRRTPVLSPHSTDHIDYQSCPLGGTQWRNNVLAGPVPSLAPYAAADGTELESPRLGNSYLPATPTVLVTQDRVHISWADAAFSTHDATAPVIVSTDSLGRTPLSHQEYTNADGSPLTIDRDYFGAARGNTPHAGPLESAGSEVTIWPRPS